MATCPRDGTKIDVEYGMATCPQCGVVLFIDMDGEAQLGLEAEALVFDEAPVETPLSAQPPPDLPIEPVPLNMEEYASGASYAGDPVTAATQAISPGDPLGIQSYANSEVSQAKDGPLLVRIIVSGVDTKEIRESLREAITDSRFGWDVDAIMRTIANGELRIANVSPVKASVAINRLKRLPIRIRWEQYAVTQADSL